MCGFAGIAAPRSRRMVSRRELEPMLATVAHRGPDDEVFESLPDFGVGFRRLSIVDVEHGRQPLATPDGRLRLVCNGEIYNHGELRRELGARGHAFRTGSDSEVVLHAYAEWGEHCPERLRGIFAFALWDAAAGRLLLARDRSGIKPLFLRVDGDELAFGSEAKAVLAQDGCPRRIDLLSCFTVAETGAALESSPFEGVWQLGAGCAATFGPDAALRTRRYWSYAPASEPGDAAGAEAHVDEFREELLRVVPMQMMADEPVGAMLSGGLDSALVCGAMGAPGAEVFTSVASGSEDPWFAAVVAREHALQSHFVKLDAEAMLAQLPVVAWGAEGAFDIGFLGRYQLAACAREHGLKVLLSGQGADELTGGYHGSYAAFAAAARRAEAATRLLDTGWADLAGVLSPPPGGPGGDPAGHDPAEAQRVAAWLERWHSGLSAYLLRFEDRMGMLAGIEVRVPLLDHVLVEICARVPPEHRRTLFGDKRLLRDAAAGLVPESVRLRDKYAFNGSLGPISQVLARSSGESWAGELLTDAAVRDRGYFDPAAVRALRATRNFRMLDGVLTVHMLDALFVTDFDPQRFRHAPLPPGGELEAGWRPARAAVVPAGATVAGAAVGEVAAAPAAPDDPKRAEAAPVLQPNVTHVGLLHDLLPATGDAPPAPLLTVRFSDGRHALAPLPAGLDGELVLAVARGADGHTSCASLAAALGRPLDDLLAAAALLREQGALAPDPVP